MKKPFKGLTFCPTALPEEVSRNVSRKITKLGGGYSRDLTKSVNVLIVGSIATNKYRFAAQHRADIAFIDAAAIDTIYDLWLTGEDISMESHSNYSHVDSNKDRMLKVLHSRYQLGPLKDFVVFIGRINNTRDEQLSLDKLDTLCIQQGVHSCNTRHFVKESHWTRPTVFVTDHPHGARVDAARLQGLPIVHPKWIFDCHRRNALLDFVFYLLEKNLSADFSAIGEGACSCWPEVLLRQNLSDDSLSHEEFEQNQHQRNVMDRFSSQGNRLWNSVMHKASNPGTIQNETQTTTRAIPKQKALKLLEDQTYYLLQFPPRKKAILETIIVQNGGQCHEYDPERNVLQNSFLVVPSNLSVPILDSLGKTFQSVVTEFYFERCLHYKKLLTPDAWCTPFSTEFKINASQGLKSHTGELDALNVAITGFQGVELLHITKMLESLASTGLRLREALNKETDFLVINLGALTSIHETHPLWKNEFASMFAENRIVQQNQVHRNSMKRKIEFIKQRHSIPVVTAAFVVEIFKRASKLQALGRETAKIHLNDVNWCISCPKGDRDQLYLEICSKPPTPLSPAVSLSARNELLKKLNPGGASPSRNNRSEIIARFNDATTKPSVPQSVTKRSHSDLDVLPSALNQNALPRDKIPKLAPTEPLQPIQRSSSWGRMLSDQARKSESVHEAYSSNSATEEEQEEKEEVTHTQVTYGSPHRKMTSHVTTKRLTRQNMREIDT
ncbi:LAFA_0A02938g1_1 [Lachancea sp. 'fantastica']|nr:LAFA_0A02938g1_1 [Lachancea sp. 'fantastica']